MSYLPTVNKSTYQFAFLILLLISYFYKCSSMSLVSYVTNYYNVWFITKCYLHIWFITKQDHLKHLYISQLHIIYVLRSISLKQISFILFESILYDLYMFLHNRKDKLKLKKVNQNWTLCPCARKSVRAIYFLRRKIHTHTEILMSWTKKKGREKELSNFVNWGKNYNTSYLNF